MTTVDHDMLIATLDRLKLTAIRDQLDTLLDETRGLDNVDRPESIRTPQPAIVFDYLLLRRVDCMSNICGPRRGHDEFAGEISN